MASHFTRTVEDDVVVFTIAPAAVSAWFAYLVLYPILIWVGSFIGAGVAGPVGGVLGFLGGAALCYWFHNNLKKQRTPIELRVGDDGLRVRDALGAPNAHFPLQDIAEITVWDPRTRMSTGSTSSFVIGGRGAVGVGLAASAAMAHGTGEAYRSLLLKIAARQLELRLRRRSHSKPEKIARQLTPDEATALLSDLCEELRERLERTTAAA